jgi:hypothetical protein
MKNCKILHITDFHLRHDSRLYYSTARKLNNGFIRNNYYVNELSERDFEKKLFFFDKSNYNKKIIEVVENLNPTIIVLGHCTRINVKTFEYIKKVHPNIKIAQWYIDSLIPTGPDYSSHLKTFNKYINFIDCSFVTSDPLSLKFYNTKNKNIFYIPNPSDISIDNLKVDQITNNIYDIFIALSHGQHRATLKRFYKDEREDFIKKLQQKLPDIIFDNYGIANNQPVWGDQYYKRLSQSKMALNLSRGLPFKWYSSDRISSFIPNGITTFIDRATKLDDFFSDDEVVFYKNINDLGNLINELKNNDKKRRSIGQKGRVKYNTHFNSTKVAKFIFEKTLNLKLSEKYFWDR